MERRIRTFAERHAIASLTGYMRRAAPRTERSSSSSSTVSPSTSPSCGAIPSSSRGWPMTCCRELAERGRIRCWSAGCSYGAEAFTLAGVAADRRPARAHRGARHRHRCPHRRPCPRGPVHGRGHAQRRRRSSSTAGSSRPQMAATSRRRSCAPHHVRDRRPAARPVHRRRDSTWCCAETSSSTSPSRCGTSCTRASSTRCAPAAT